MTRISGQPAEQVEAIRRPPVLGFALTEGPQRMTVLHHHDDKAVT